MPNYENLRLGALLYGFSGDNTSALIGGGLTFNYAINDIISFEGQYTYDKTNEHAGTGGIRLTLPLDGNLSRNYNRTEKLFVTRVQRDIDIVTNRKIVPTQVEELQPNIVAIKKSELFKVVKSSDDNFSATVYTDSVIDIISSKKTTIIVDDNIPDGEPFPFSDIAMYNFEPVSKNEIAVTPIVVKEDGKLVLEDDKKQNVTIPVVGKDGTLVLEGDKKQNVTISLVGKDGTVQSIMDKIVIQPPIKKDDVKRAGIMPVVKKDGKYYILLCKETDKDFYEWPSGKVEAKDNHNFKVTAVRETFEEAMLKIVEADVNKAINNGTFILDSSAKTFAAIIKFDNLDTKKMTAEALKKNKDPTIPSCMKEKDGYSLVPAEEIKKLAQDNAGKKFNKATNPANVKTIDNEIIRLQSNYANSLINCAKQLEDSIKSMK